MDLTGHLAEQLSWHWENHLRPRFEGLTDEEYLWQPAPGCWTIRARRDASEPGSGPYTADYAYPAPTPAPLTTIAWRMAHIASGVFGQRSHSHFGGPDASYETFRYQGTAADALAQLDEAYARWMTGVRTLSEEDLRRPVGPAEGPFAALPMLDLVLHIHREAIHHGAEIALLRDLYLRRSDLAG